MKSLSKIIGTVWEKPQNTEKTVPSKINSVPHMNVAIQNCKMESKILLRKLVGKYISFSLIRGSSYWMIDDSL